MTLKDLLDKVEPFRWICIKGFDAPDDIPQMQSVRDPSFVAIGNLGMLNYSLDPKFFAASVIRVTSNTNIFDSDEPSMLEIWVKHPIFEVQEEIQNGKC